MRTIILAVLFIAALASVNYNQTRRKTVPKSPAAASPQPSPQPIPEPRARRVVIKLKNGQSLDADFIEANAEYLEARVAGNRLRVAVEDVAAIVLAPESIKPEARFDNAESALKSLKKMAGAIEVGINYLGYGSRLVDIRNEVDEPLANIKDADIKAELTNALVAYVDAGQAWSRLLKGGSSR